MQEGLHFSFQGMADTLIDYPNSKGYVFEVLETFAELAFIDSAEKYKQHIEMLESGGYEDSSASN